MEYGTLIAVLVAGLAALTQIEEMPRAQRRASFRALGFYTAFLACGVVALLILLGTKGDAAAGWGIVGILAWVGLGILWLLRIAPPAGRPTWPFLLRRWSPLDWVLIAIVAAAALLAALA